MHKISKETLEQWKKLHSDGWSYQKIADMYGVNKTLVLSRLINRANGFHYYKGKYILAFYGVDGKLAMQFNNIADIDETFIQEKNKAYTKISKYFARESNKKGKTIDINGIPYFLFAINKDEKTPESIEELGKNQKENNTK